MHLATLRLPPELNRHTAVAEFSWRKALSLVGCHESRSSKKSSEEHVSTKESAACGGTRSGWSCSQRGDRVGMLGDVDSGAGEVKAGLKRCSDATATTSQIRVGAGRSRRLSSRAHVIHVVTG